MTNAEAAASLGVATRQLRRLKANYKQAGGQGLVHGGRGRRLAYARKAARHSAVLPPVLFVKLVFKDERKICMFFQFPYIISVIIRRSIVGTSEA
jgi:hypothetical protein